MKQDLANLLAHGTNVQQQVYNDANTQLKSIWSSKLLEKLMTKKVIKEEESPFGNFPKVFSVHSRKQILKLQLIYYVTALVIYGLLLRINQLFID